MNHARFLDAAYAVALLSPGVGGRKRNFRLGAVLVRQRRIVAVGCNSMETDPKYLKYFKYPYPHAESSTIFRYGLDRSEGCVLYCVRVKKNGSVGLAKPCPSCEELLYDIGIRRCIYSVEHSPHYTIMEF